MSHRSRISTDDVLTLLCAYIHQTYGPAVHPASVRIDLGPTIPPWRCSFPPHLPGARRRESAPDDMGEMDQTLLEAATDKPVVPRRLVHLAGYRWNSNTRAAIARLVRSGKLVRINGALARGDKKA